MRNLTLTIFELFFMLGMGMLIVLMCAIFLNMMDSFITGGRVGQKLRQYMARKLK